MNEREEKEMGLFDELGKKVTAAGQKTVQKTKEVTDVARINSLISQEEKRIENIYLQIGKVYVAKHGNDCDEEMCNLVDAVKDLEEKVREYREQIQDIKGIQRCPSCGAVLPREAVFCSSCGTSVINRSRQEDLGNNLVCPVCGSSVKEGMLFCVSCGSPIDGAGETETPPGDVAADDDIDLPEKDGRNCPNCGAALKEGTLFCTECGTKL